MVENVGTCRGAGGGGGGQFQGSGCRREACEPSRVKARCREGRQPRSQGERGGGGGNQSAEALGFG